MGHQCCSGISSQHIPNQFQYRFGEDDLENNIIHSDTIVTFDQSIKFNLKDCQQRLKKSQKLYKDQSLKSDPIILKSSNQAKQIKCIFYRPYQFLNDKQAARTKIYKIYESESNSSFIFTKNNALQYFGAFLCFLADNIHLVKDIILTEANSYGINVLKLYVNGDHIPIYIDDYILCEFNHPVFSQPIRGIYMWPCLLQKAWHKIKGYGDKKIEKLSPAYVFQHFLLYPFRLYSLTQIEVENYQNLKKNELQNYYNWSYILTSKKDPLHKIGLSGQKHFYLKKYFQFQGRSLYYIRNPQGAFDFRGFNRTITIQLQNKIKNETGQYPITEGNFILQEYQFLQQIEEILVIYYKKQSNIISEQIVQIVPNEQFYVQFDLQKQEDVNLSFLQYQLQENGQFYPLTFQVLQKDEKQDYKIISGLSNQQGCFGVRSTNLLYQMYNKLPAGHYLIRILKKDFNRGQLKAINKTKDKIIFTASNKIQIKISMTNRCKNEFQQFLRKYGNSKLGQPTKESRYRGPIIQYVTVWLGDMVFIYIFRKIKSNMAINLQVSFPNKVNLQCTSHNLSNEYSTIQMLDDQLLIIFEKQVLSDQTSLGKYYIETF